MRYCMPSPIASSLRAAPRYWLHRSHTEVMVSEGPEAGVYANRPPLLPLATEFSHLRASSRVAGFTSSPAICPLLRAMSCQPKTEVSPPACLGWYHQPP